MRKSEHRRQMRAQAKAQPKPVSEHNRRKQLEIATRNLQALLWLVTHANGGSITIVKDQLEDFKPNECKLEVEGLLEGGYKVIASKQEPSA